MAQVVKKTGASVCIMHNSYDTINMILGLLMLTALLVFGKTGNRFSMYTIIFSGGLMNISNGYRFLGQKGKRQMGQSMILFGIVILFLGMIVVLL